MNIEFANRLNALLEAKDLKIIDLVNVSGLSKQAVYDIANGKVENYNKKFIDSLTSYTNVNLNWLLTGLGNMFNTGDVPTNMLPKKIKTIEELEMQNMILQARLEEQEKVIDKFMARFPNPT